MRPFAIRAAPAIIAIALAGPGIAGGSESSGSKGQGELLFFASADGVVVDSEDALYDGDDVSADVDVLGSFSFGGFRVLGEFLLSTDEQELERLQFGWEVRPETYLWLGRFHQPASVWNTRHHHGSYLQPSITRPAIESWEDEGGVLPQHFVGALGETRLPIGATGGLSLQAGLGAGPKLQERALMPVEIYDLKGLDGRGSWSLRAAYLPEYEDEDAIGLVASGSEIDLSGSSYVGPASHVDLRVLGLFASWQHGPSRLDAAGYLVRSSFVGAAGGAEEFAAGYVQFRREFSGGLSLLGRLEGSADTSDSGYLALFPGFVKQRVLADLRWDFRPQHAISVEIASNRVRGSDFRELRLQWSAVLP